MILVVDDHADSCETLRRLLARAGYAVVCALKGQEAIDYLRGERPQLIFLDSELTDMSGLDVLQMIRSSQQLKDVPVVIWSGYPRGSLEEFERLGIQGWILKGSNGWEQIQQYARLYTTP